MSWRLSRSAAEDLETLLYDLAVSSGWDFSMTVESKLYAAFDSIAASPGIGHLRRDLLPREIYFFYTKPYLLLYRRSASPIIIGAIIHGARDVAALLADRPF